MSIMRILIIISSVMFSCIANAQYNYIHTTSPPITLTLKDAIFLALRHNENIQSAYFQRVIEKFDLRTAQWQFEPQLSLEGSLSSQRSKSNSILSHSQSYILTPGVRLLTSHGGVLSANLANSSDGIYFNPELTLAYTQPLLRGFHKYIVEAALYNAMDQNEIGKLNMRGSIISEITTLILAYRNLQGSENNLILQKQALARSQRTADQTRKRIKAGTKAPADLAQAQVNVEQDKLGVVETENQIVQAKQQLLITIGLSPMTNIVIEKHIATPHFKIPNLHRSIALALSNDPTYQTDLLSLKIDERSLMVARDNTRWQLDAGFTATFGGGSGGTPFNNYRSLFNGTNNSQQVTLTLSIPIYNYDLKQGVVDAKVALEQQKLTTSLEKRTVISQVINDINNIKNAQLALKIAADAAKLAYINLQNEYRKYRYGQTTMLSVTQQQQALLQQQQAYLLAKIQYLNSITTYRETVQSTLRHWDIKLRY